MTPAKPYYPAPAGLGMSLTRGRLIGLFAAGAAFWTGVVGLVYVAVMW